MGTVILSTPAVVFYVVAVAGLGRIAWGAIRGGGQR